MKKTIIFTILVSCLLSVGISQAVTAAWHPATNSSYGVWEHNVTLSPSRKSITLHAQGEVAPVTDSDIIAAGKELVCPHGATQIFARDQNQNIAPYNSTVTIVCANLAQVAP